MIERSTRLAGGWSCRAQREATPRTAVVGHAPTAHGPWAEAMGTHFPFSRDAARPTIASGSTPFAQLFPPCFLLGFGYHSPCVSETRERDRTGLVGTAQSQRCSELTEGMDQDHLSAGGTCCPTLVHCLQKKSRQQFAPTCGVLEGLAQCLLSPLPHSFKYSSLLVSGKRGGKKSGRYHPYI